MFSVLANGTSIDADLPRGARFLVRTLSHALLVFEAWLEAEQDAAAQAPADDEWFYSADANTAQLRAVDVGERIARTMFDLERDELRLALDSVPGLHPHLVEVYDQAEALAEARKAASEDAPPF
jgi:hypothetical protein